MKRSISPKLQIYKNINIIYIIDFNKQFYILLTFCLIVDNDVDKNEYQTEKITKPQKKFGRNPFIDDSSDSENEEHNLEDKEEHFDAVVDEVPSGKFLGSRGVWREVFFFKVDDSRFKGTN